MKPGDVTILASDGFWNHMESNEDTIHCASLWIDAESANGKCGPGEGVDPDRTGVEDRGLYNANTLWRMERRIMRHT